MISGDETVSLRTVSPNPFTPNADGINDEAEWNFDVFLLTAQAEISVTLYTLNGTRLRELTSSATSGAKTLVWDGRDESNNLVPPGLYLYRLFVDSDTDESKEKMGIVSVAY